ncbi:MAG TPA: hypothetical protein EYG99_02445 [Candidatus Pacebacteria bacterium]|nr:hypothetical protein [Candidatus Paceibacterota bacterium]
MNENKIRDIITKYNTAKVSNIAETDYLWPRFERAALNQITDGSATVSRYGIWADTVKGHAIMAKENIEKMENRDAIEHLTKVINSLSAFSELQEELDPLKHA